MAKKAKLLAIIIENALNSDEENQQNSSLKEQMDAFKEILIHNIKPKEFADIYAQTIAYGMFAARLHDQSLNTFSRQEAADLIPKTNPFLRKLFQYVAGYDLDTRISWIVDDLAEIFRATDIAALLKNFGAVTKRQDPIIHFYETFLSEYDPSLRKSRGVWYTPEPVVNFLVRATDEILKTEFGLKDGLADTTKIKKKINTHLRDKRMIGGYKQDEIEFHKVQILDPATGTGTFLTEVIKQIHQKFIGQQGIWSRYVDEHLIPRLNGFELLWINDDYVKFLRFGQYFIEKNGEGILAFINPHGFLDNPTFRGMRFSLLQSYDKIYTIDLHGNSKKKETTPSGEKDENVFDIQQGVSINIFVKNGKKKSGELAQVFHFDCFGKREDKYNFLWENSLSSIAFKTLPKEGKVWLLYTFTTKGLHPLIYSTTQNQLALQI